jgi:excisionase family DNA binding protein
MTTKNNDVNIILTSQAALTSLIKEAVRDELTEHQRAAAGNEGQDKIFTVDTVCQYLDLKPATIYTMTHKKAIPFFKKGKKLYFKKSQIDKWLAGGRVLTNDELDAVAERMQNKPGGSNDC